MSENTRDENTNLFPFLLQLRFRKFRRKSCSNNTRKIKTTVLKDFGMRFKRFVIAFQTVVEVYDVTSRKHCNVIILHNGANSVPIHKKTLIPVHDRDSTKTVASLGHHCSKNCASALSTSLSKSDGEVEIVEHPVKCMERQTCRSPYEDVEHDCVVNNDQESAAENELNETTELKTVVQSEKLEDNCSYCQEETSETFDLIQCNDCKSWCHYKCTRLPLYQLYIYDLSNRKCSCENCVEVPGS